MSSNAAIKTVNTGKLTFFLALIFAILFTNSFADMAQVPPPTYKGRFDEYSTLRLMCGGVLFFAAFYFLRFLLQLTEYVIGWLGRLKERPPLALSIALVVCGTACLLGSLAVEYQAISVSMAISPLQLAAPGSDSGYVIRTDSAARFLPQLMALFIAVTGCSLIALGVWGSLGRTWPTTTTLPADVSPITPPSIMSTTPNIATPAPAGPIGLA